MKTKTNPYPAYALKSDDSNNENINTLAICHKNTNAEF
jgi:hypothetical protein